MVSNPIVPGFNPDPSLIRVGSDYFLATSTFEYFPGVAIHHSKDLVNWKIIGHALNRPSQLNMRNVCPGGGIYAPTLRYWKGRFYVATSVVYDRPGGGHQEPRGFYVSTDDIFDNSKWSEPVYFEMLGIDQDLFFDDDDRVYLCTARSNHGHRQPKGAHLTTYGCEIDLVSGRSLSKPVLLRASDALASLQATDEGGGIAEGPHIYKFNGWYYLLTAEGGTSINHQVWIARSKSPLGPYEQPPKGVNPIVYNAEDEKVQATGHADIFEGTDGRWWIVMLARRIMAHGKSQLGRETYLAPMEWKDGWPVVNGGKKITLEVEADLPEKTTSKEWRDDFTSDKLNVQWQHLRTPIMPTYSLTQKPNHLTLYGSPQKITDLESPSMLLRRQTSYNGTWKTRMINDPTDEWEEAGTVVWYSRWSYIAILVRKNGKGEKEVVVRWTDAENDKAVKEKAEKLTSTSTTIDFEIKATETTYTLSYTSEGTTKTLAEISSDSVCEEDLIMKTGSENPFTATFFGLFNQGIDGEMCQSQAHFEYASWIEE